MIVPMKKAIVITQAKDSDSAVLKLRSLGLLHVENQNPPKAQDIALLKDDIDLVNRTISVLSREEFLRSAANKEQAKEIENWKVTAKHIVDCSKRLAQLQEYSSRLVSSIAQWQEWGDFDPQSIEDLKKNNVYIRLYAVPVKELDKFPSQVIVKVISRSKGTAKCAVISRENIQIPFKEIALAKTSLEKMRARLSEDKKVMQLINEDLSKQAVLKNKFILIKQSLEKNLEFQEALYGMGQTESLAYIKGYIPFDGVKTLLDAAKTENWGVSIDDPSDEDNVPTLIRNPRWISIINPVFKALEVVPGYRELDISPLFLIFLSLFFGMIIGDAGYGAIYFLFTYFMHKKFEKRVLDTRIFYLFYLFSSCAIFWGLLTGTVFGQEWYLNSGYRPLIPILNDTKFLQAFCFALGAFHLTLAHAWQALRKIPSVVALSDVGWICVLWAGFFMAKMLILNDPFPFFGKRLLIAGLLLVVFFTSPQKNILKTVGQGLGAVALSLMNNFTDVVSYVRLFAVGLAGVAISDTVNTLAAGLGGSSAVGKFIILFIGHTINITLGPLSVLVHGIRLNVLEFSGHVGLSWSGYAYKPLKD
jgi:V/A-type H+-transporting ATPase subunit I